MNYLEDLKRIRKLAQEGELQANISTKVENLIEQLADKAISTLEEDSDYFKKYYEDIIQDELNVDFRSIVGTVDYSYATEYAKSCLKIATSIKSLPRNVSLGNWISNMLLFIDFLVLNYIQEVKGLKLTKESINEFMKDNKIEENFKEERQRYAILKSYPELGDTGKLLDQMYLIRNRVLHNTVKKKKKQVLRLSNFGDIRSQAQRKCPEIFEKFKKEYSK